MNRKTWERATEQVTLTREPDHASDAGRKFDALSEEQQWQIAEEIVETRSRELCQAFSNVISIYPGYRTRRARTKSGISLRNQTCVVFVVKRKWTEGKGDDAQRIPDRLFSYIGTGKKRTLVAVPTDVVPASEHIGAELQYDIRVEGAGGISQGTVTCGVVRRRGNRTANYLMSCRHVYSFVKSHYPDTNAGSRVLLRNGAALGRVTSVAGDLHGPHGFGLDAQLASPASETLFDTIVNTKKLNGVWARGWSEVPQTCYIQTRRGAIAVRKSGLIQAPLDYGNAGYVTHRSLIKSLIGNAAGPYAGDSGSPVTSTRHGGQLVGMHIALRKVGQKRFSLIVPAWLLFNPANYHKTHPGERWRIA